MSLEIRTISGDEMEQAEMISLQAFASSDRNNPASAIERTKRFFQPDWHLASFEDGEMTSMMRMLPFAMRINGRGLPFAAVGPVANSPLHRRRGHTGAMLRRSLEVMRERGQWLSGLYTPHPAFYRRYGWDIAADERIYSFKPKDCRLTAEPSQRGRLRWIKPDAWHELDAIYRRHSADRNGPLHRGEVWWRNSILAEAATPPAAPCDAVIWESDAGAPEGYVVFIMPIQGTDAGKVVSLQFAALTADAYLNLTTFLGRHDIHNEIKLFRPSDDPLPLLFEDTDRLEIRQGYTALLRIVDVEAALKTRPAARRDIEAEFSVEVRDQCASWNEGVFRLTTKDGSVEVERTSGDADLSIEARVLAPIFNGYLTPSAAAATGQVRVQNVEALAQADDFFAVGHRPYFPDRF